MAGRDLLPPLYGIVYEYLTLSEQWYVTKGAEGAEGSTAGTGALDQFKGKTSEASQFKGKTSEASQFEVLAVLQDAIETDHFPVFRAARVRLVGGDPNLSYWTALVIIKHDRVKMLELYDCHMRMIDVMTNSIMQSGATQILRHAHGKNMRGFGSYTYLAARNGHLQCLQELARLEPEYKGESDVRLYQEAVASDNVEMVQFIETTWPQASELHPRHDPRNAKTLACAEAKSAKMVNCLLDSISEHDRAGRVSKLVQAAVAANSVEMFEAIAGRPHLRKIATVAGLMRASSASAIYKHLRSGHSDEHTDGSRDLDDKASD